MIRLENFTRDHYSELISWIEDEEALMQFAGPAYHFPLTSAQLDSSLSDDNRIAFRVVHTETNLSIGHAEIELLGNVAKLGRILIGDKSQRGKGMGQQIIHLLLNYTFVHLHRTRVELNVFDWNIAAIKCYEKVGFIRDENKKLERKINGQVWTAFSMSIEKQDYDENKSK